MPPTPPERKRDASPVETGAKSSTDSKDGAPKVRRWNVEPVETTTSSSKSARGKAAEKDEKPKPRKFAVQPVEHSQRSSKDRSRLEKSPQIHSHVEDEDDNRSGGPSRSWTPIVVEIATRSRRSDPSSRAMKTESGFDVHAREHRRHITGTDSPTEMDIDDPGDSNHAGPRGHELSSALRRQISLDGTRPDRSRMASMSTQRTHSFRCPDLDTIESSESEPSSSASSLSASPGDGSPLTNSDSSFNELYKHATRKRESVDESFTHYLLQIEAKKAAQRMQEQALAAFANSDFHEPVQHYVNDDRDSDDMEVEDRPVTFAPDDDFYTEMTERRDSTAKVSWEMLEMQRHAQVLETERNTAKVAAKAPAQSPWWNPAVDGQRGRPDNELASMQDRARPPMLGGDLSFPRCSSPEPARFDVTQGSAALRNQMCYLTEQAENKPDDDAEGLWRPQNTEKKPLTSIRSPAKTNSSTKQGLWGGFCVGDGQSAAGLGPPSGPTGLMTPMPLEHATNPFDNSLAAPSTSSAPPERARLRPSPAAPPASLTPADLANLDSVLVTEQDLDALMAREYPPSFVTQVYNYLSLGYPALARAFDAELSKITRVPLAELRHDDRHARRAPRGHIRLGPDFEGGGGEGLDEEACVRWQALRRYIREWARQEKNMVRADGPLAAWGTTARRGSWAI